MATEKVTAPYGTWDSQITIDLVSGANNSFTEVHVNPRTETVYLIESRPAEKGRSALVNIKEGVSKDILPNNFSISSKVHEYGGGAGTMCRDGSFIFTDTATRGIFRMNSSFDVQNVLEGNDSMRYADFDVHPLDPRWILAVREDHTIDTPATVINTIVAIDSVTKLVKVVCTGADFYSHPKFSTCRGEWISWVQWSHPDMPWTGSKLFAAEWSNGTLSEPRFVAGKEGTEAVTQPKWHSYGGLMFTSDRTGYHQLYLWDPMSFETRQISIPGYEDASFSIVKENLGSCTYVELNPSTLVVSYIRKASAGLILVGITSGRRIPLPTKFVSIGRAGIRRVSDTSFVAIAATSTSPEGLYYISIDPNNHAFELLRSSSSTLFDPSVFSPPVSIAVRRTQGKDPQGETYAIYLPPHNPLFTAPEGSKPPLIVSLHGGPTANATPALLLQTQYWTSRGYAYVHVNYAGSTGYGRAYQESLNYNWGIKDVDDAASCVALLVKQGVVDGSRIGIVGSSAGGYTVLKAMIDYPTIWAAGNCMYGIGNLRDLAAKSHKFESHYLFSLIFEQGITKEEQEAIFDERSPCLHAEKIESPLLLVQGIDDRVVPMHQAVDMEKLLREGGKDVKLILFGGEGHGIKMEDNIRTAIREEEALWRRTLVRL